MATLKKRLRTQETPLNPNNEQSEAASGYEQCREQRIRENMERMHKLGLFDLSSKLKPEIVSSKRPYSKKNPQVAPSRRSSRLQNATPISYVEKRGEKKEKEGELGAFVAEGLRPEIYTEEHEKLLGTCEGTWTLFVDGYGKDGKRVYDPIKGKTCHQCRQKTLGHRTHCCKCQLVQGQFCGDCLYMRYGEHVLEVNQNPNWICPVCRGICNCSLCRQAKGWPATGTLYRRISKLGFKSVAHYLIQTQRAETKSGDAGSDDTIPVKRSLDFVHTKEVAEHKDSFISENGQDGNPKHGSMDKKGNKLERKEETVHSVSVNGVGNVKDESTNEHVNHESQKHVVVDKRGDELEGYKVKPLNLTGMHDVRNFEEEHGNLKDGFINKKDGVLEGKKEELLNLDGANDVRTVEDEAVKEHGAITVVSPPSPENPERKCRKVRPRCNESTEPNSDESELEKEEPMNDTKCKMNSVLVIESISDNIPGELRQRSKAT